MRRNAARPSRVSGSGRGQQAGLKTMTGTKWTRIAILAVVGVSIVAFFLSPWRDAIDVEGLREVLDQFSEIWYGPIVFIAIYIVGCVLFLPASVFIVVAGVVWGWKFGGLYALIGGSLGAFTCFELGRYVLGDLAWKLLARRGPKLAALLGRADFRSLFMLRLVPLLPFPVFNYGAGLTAVRARDFYLSTVLGIAAPTFVIAFSSDALLSGELSGQEAFRRLLIVGSLLLALVGIPTLIKKRIKGVITETEATDPPGGTSEKG